MVLTDFIHRMPKVELHVHLEGSVRPETLLQLARRHGVQLPADTIEELRDWHAFTNFDHFIDIYTRLSECIRTPDDIELIAREFLEGQAAQNIKYSKVTYTAYTHNQQKGIPFDEQLDALNRACDWDEKTLGVRMNYIIDIPRQVAPERGIQVAKWVISGMGRGVIALGLGGLEIGHPPEKFIEAFRLAEKAGLPAVPHAGETVGPESIWGALRALKAVRIGHGVRCLEDPALVDYLREHQIPLEVCPTSNVCLKVARDFANHPLPSLLAEGLYVTLNSDDPSLFKTTLTDEYRRAADAFGLTEADLEKLVMNAARVTLLPENEQGVLMESLWVEFANLRDSANE